MKYFANVIVLCAMLVTVTGCSNLNSEEKKVVGKYQFLVSETETPVDDGPSMSMTMDGISYYKADKTVEATGKLTMIVDFDTMEYYNKFTFECDFEATGEWFVENGEIHEKTNAESLKIHPLKSTATNDDELAQLIKEAMEANFSTYMEAYQNELLEGTTLTILEISKDKMVLTDGESEMTYYRM